MDFDEMPGSGGSTPLQDEQEYGFELEGDQVVSSNAAPKPMSGDDDDDYVNDGGEVEREEVEDMDQDNGPASPTQSGSAPGSPDGSPPASPTYSAPGSPDGSPPASPAPSYSPAGSPRSPRSPAGSGPASPTGSRSPGGSPARGGSVSPARSGSPLGSPAGSGPASPTGSGPASPTGSGPASPTGSGAGSPARRRSASPAGSGRGSPAGSRSPSPAGRRSASRSPARSRSASPARSRSRSRSGSRSRSRSGSPAQSRSRSVSRSRSRSRSVSPTGSGTPPYSPLGSPAGSGAGSPGGSDSGPGSPAGSDSDLDMDDKDGKGRGSDDEDSDKEHLVADIFGDSDEEEEFEGFGEADVEATARKKEKSEKKKIAILSDDEDDDDDLATGAPDEENQHTLPDMSDDENDRAARESAMDGDSVSDFDLMMAKKKEEMQKTRKKKKEYDLINDSDDLIDDMIKKMKLAAEEDRELNMERKPAIRKLKYLTIVQSQLKKSDLHGTFLECGILGAMTEWLAPLPDKSLPNLQIRENFLKILQTFPSLSSGGLKSSGIGKAVMYLYKHPKETKENKERAGKLINEWSRPIFNLTSNYKALSKEERQQRDYDQLPKRRRTSVEEGGMTPRKDLDKSMSGDQKPLRPGDPGWIYRARVPMPSNKDYVNRPRWTIEEVSMRTSRKKEPTRYEKHVRAFAEKKKHSKSQRAIGISIEGKNMAL